MLRRLVSYVRGLFHRRRISDEVDDELRFHLEQSIDVYVARGVAPGEARRLALRDLGGLPQTREAVRDVRTIWLDLWWRDLRHAARALRATPGFTAVALVVLTLSIGASTAIYSVVDAVVLRSLPFEDGGRLVAIGERGRDGTDDGRRGTFHDMVATQNFLDWREQQTVFDGFAGLLWGELTLSRDGDLVGEHVFAPVVTADFFDVLRVRPLLGRTFVPADEREGSSPVAIITYDLWQRRFGGRTDVIGAPLRTSRVTFEVVGVMPRGFVYPVDSPESPSAWVPYVPVREDRIRANSFGYNVHVLGRLRDGVSLAQAQAQIDQITARLAVDAPRWFDNRAPRIEPLHRFLTGGVRGWMMLLLGAVGFVVLIACVNLANLMLVRATTRSREVAVRAALGASRWDLTRALLFESVLLSFVGAAFGIGLAWWSVDVLRAAMPLDVPRAATIAIDWRVLGATATLAITTGILFGLAPVAQFAMRAPQALHLLDRTDTGGVRTHWLRTALVVSEDALAVVLLVGSGLFLASFARVTGVDLGFDHRDVLTTRLRVSEVPADPQAFSERNRQLLLNVLRRVRALPGVTSAALLGQGMPLRGDLQTVSFGIPDRELPPNTDIALNQISPDYFRLMKVPLLAGRSFTDADERNTERVAILSEAAAAQYFPGQEAVGQVVRVAGTRTVVGVVGNVRHDGPEHGWRPQAFVPITQSAVAGATLMVRADGHGQELTPAVRRVVWEEFGTIPVRVEEEALTGYYEQLVAQRRVNMLLLSLFGGLGLLIAAVGIYGVLSYTVARRTQEIGIRSALGALPAAILAAVIGRTVKWIGVGLATGVALAWGLATAIEGFLFEIHPHAPGVYATALGILLAAAVAAAVVPARRAIGVSPLVAMRAD